ncbi:MAG: hypothetical protein CM1200mP13_11220 [Candidatus Pelagibacterales bacterium]|nr:MAG: hypothetical protein CM1200mP13_11220 [Pelagibacterales bacterium]
MWMDDVELVVSSLALKASIVLFYGSQCLNLDLLLKKAQREKITLFGISANM